jgi:hypothetical protein
MKPPTAGPRHEPTIIIAGVALVARPLGSSLESRPNRKVCVKMTMDTYNTTVSAYGANTSELDSVSASTA